MNPTIAATAAQMRQQGKALARFGQELLDAGREQVEAADKIERSERTVAAFFGTPAPVEPPSTGKLQPEAVRQIGMIRFRRAVSLTVAEAAELVLRETAPLDRNELFEKILARGASSASVSSMVSTLGQDKQKRFVSAGNGTWMLAQGALQNDLQLNEKNGEGGAA